MKLEHVVATPADPSPQHEASSLARFGGDIVGIGGEFEVACGTKEGHAREVFVFDTGESVVSAGGRSAGFVLRQDLHRRQADWVTPLRVRAWDVDLWTLPPNSQGYLILAGGGARRWPRPAHGPGRPAVGTPAHRGGGDRSRSPVAPPSSTTRPTATRWSATAQPVGRWSTPPEASRRRVPGHDGDTTYLGAPPIGTATASR